MSGWPRAIDRDHKLSITRQANLLNTRASPCSHGISRGRFITYPSR